MCAVNSYENQQKKTDSIATADLFTFYGINSNEKKNKPLASSLESKEKNGRS